MVLFGAPAAEIAGSPVTDSAWQLSAVLVAFASATNSFPLDVLIGAPIKAWGVVSPLIARPEAASISDIGSDQRLKPVVCHFLLAA
jgi:hypothetical protein